MDGELFIKPCTQAEINFYIDSIATQPEFAEFMPAFLGILTLDEQQGASIEEHGAALLAKHTNGVLVQESAALTAKHANGVLLDDGGAALVAQHTVPDVVVPVKTGKRIETNQAVVLENAAHGFCEAEYPRCEAWRPVMGRRCAPGEEDTFQQSHGGDHT